MAWLVLSEVDEFSTANSDNLQWSLAQSDVEFLRFELAVERAAGEPSQTNIDALRRRFDIFYSRMATLTEGEVFRELRANRGFDTARSNVAEFLDSLVPVIDGPDAALTNALPELRSRVTALGEDVRALSLNGLSAFAEIADARRERLSQTLFTMAGVLAAIFAGLVLLAVSLFHLMRLAEDRAVQVHRSASRMRTIVETSLDAIAVIDGYGRIREFNGSAQRIFGYSGEAARGRDAIALMFPPDQTDELRAGRLSFITERRAPAAHERQLDVIACDSAGRQFPAEISIDRADAETESNRVYVAYVRDISRRKAAEEGLTEARDRALAGERAKSEFLAVMSHEMRTPLNGLLGSMQIMQDEQLNDRQVRLLDRMMFSGRQLLGLVNDVLDLAKFEAGKMELERGRFSIDKLLDTLVETTGPLATANGNTLEWRWVGEPAPESIGDSRRLRQVLLNLVGNAVKFTRDGSIDIEVERLGSGAEVEFRVFDSGIGIAESDLERIFLDFETLDSTYARRAGGTGLGLGIARRLARMMGGELGAESELGEGSLFWLRVPLERDDTAQVPAADVPQVRARRSTPSLDLLLVEDNELNRFVAREMLEAEGHRVTEAEDGQAGVDWAEKHAFDGILMDISMPRMDGTEAARCIRQGSGPCKDVPIVAVTAHALAEELQRFREAGMMQCISKPIERQELIETLAGMGAGATPQTAEAANAPDVPADLPLLDEAQLAALWHSVAPTAGQKLLARFLGDTDCMIATLSQADPEWPELAQTAHKCAGGCATFGAVALRQALADIETAAKRGTPVADADLRALAVLWAQTRSALEEWRVAA